MAVIENTTYRLAAGVDGATFLAADHRVQTEFFPYQQGFLRRTTARGADGEWLSAVLWSTADDGDVSARAAAVDLACAEFAGLVDPASRRVSRYTTLD